MKSNSLAGGRTLAGLFAVWVVLSAASSAAVVGSPPSAVASAQLAELRLSSAPIRVQFPEPWRDWGTRLATEADSAASSISGLLAGTRLPAGVSSLAARSRRHRFDDPAGNRAWPSRCGRRVVATDCRELRQRLRLRLHALARSVRGCQDRAAGWASTVAGRAPKREVGGLTERPST